MEKLGLKYGQANFYPPKGRIINKLIESQGIQRQPITLSFSSKQFSGYKMKMQLEIEEEEWVSYKIISGPPEVLNLDSKWYYNRGYIYWDIRKTTVLAFFPTVPEFIYLTNDIRWPTAYLEIDQ